MSIDEMLNYENFSEEVKNYLNKAMDIYFTIKDKEIKKEIKLLFGTREFIFKDFDKKIISLYIAAFLTEGDMKKKLDQYKEIKVIDLLSFIDIDFNDIRRVDENGYKKFYSDNFRSDLVLLMNSKKDFYIYNSITPEVIFSFLDGMSVNGSRVLNCLCEFLKLGGYIWLSDHPSFKEIRQSAISKGDMEKRDPIVFDEGHKIIHKIGRVDRFTKGYGMSETDFSRIRDLFTEEDKKSEKLSLFEGDKIWSILDDIQKKFVGQETAAEDLFYNIVNNQQLALRDDVSDGERSIIFLDGPTGTGKTAITREITDKLDIPFTATSATNYSSTGYVGGNITDTLKELYNKSNGDIEKAQRGIIVFDEFDKLAYSRSGGLEMKKAVQQQLLDFMGGGKYTINVGSGLFSSQQVEFDTSKLTFVCLAALSDLRNEKTEVKSSIGFGGNVGSTKVQEYTITPQDLIGIGLERELVGRLNTFLHTEEYSKEDLLKILKESTISPLLGFEKWVTSKGKTLAIGEDVYDIIVDAAYDLNTGARSLQTIMNNIRTRYLKEVMRGISKEIKLDKETVLAITEGTFNRRGRR